MPKCDPQDRPNSHVRFFISQRVEGMVLSVAMAELTRGRLVTGAGIRRMTLTRVVTQIVSSDRVKSAGWSNLLWS